MQIVKISDLKPHPKNDYFFDDMSPGKWKEFLESVRTRGVIEPVVITPDYVIVSGHQRVKACKELGIENVVCDVHTYNNEDEIIQDLLETNIRQRGEVSGSAKKTGRRIKELERIYGISVGNNQYGYEKNSQAKTQSNLATDMNMDVRTLQNYKLLADMIPELSELVDTGIVTKTTALSIMNKLSEEEQLKLIQSMDVTKKLTNKEVKKYIDELEEKEAELQAQKELNDKYSALSPEIDELVKKKKIQYTDVLNMAKNNLSDEELVQFVKAVNNGKKYTEEQMEEEVRKWKVKTNQLTQEKDEIAL